MFDLHIKYLKNSHLYWLVFIICSYSAIAQNYVEITPRSGDGIRKILSRYLIPVDRNSIKKFKEINKIPSRNNKIYIGRSYFIPVIKHEFNGKTIRSSIGNNDYDYALKIQNYNEALTELKIKPDFRDSKDLWEPLFLHDVDLNEVEAVEKEIEYPIFGEKYSKVPTLGNELKGRVYYIVSGHGGPDPGAVGKKLGRELHEDEYAYDFALRLSRRLIEHGATVYIIVRDSSDGIREDAYLNNSYDEYYLGGYAIDPDQRTRLQKRVDIINELYNKHKETAVTQKVIALHVDSRSLGKRIDIFFYHNPGSSKGEILANILQETIEAKYRRAQPGRGYHGTVSPRALFMTRKTIPLCVFIELGNIRNPQDQVRFIKENNRQAIANWLCDGLIKAAKTMK